MKIFKKYYLIIFALISVFFVFSFVRAESMSQRLKGKILLQVENNGEAWYVSPKNEMRYFMGRPDDAFSLMREQGVGITNTDLYKIPVGIINEGYQDSDQDGLSDYLEDTLGLDKNTSDTDGDGYNDNDELKNGYSPWGPGGQSLDNNFSKAQAGKILLQVEKNGEAWYVNPENNRRYFLGRPNDAFSIMRNLGLGITNKDLEEVYAADIDSSSICSDECPLLTPLSPDYCSGGILVPSENDECGCPTHPTCQKTDDECSTCPPYTVSGCPDSALVYQGKDECGCFLPPLCDESSIEDEEDPTDLDSFDSCEDDSDCVSVSLDCCGCTAGGMATVINSNYLELWSQIVLGECEEQGCTAVMSQHISCFSDGKCIDGTCILDPNVSEVCSSGLYSNCQEAEGDELTETKDEYGTSCQEILNMCD